MDTMDKSDSKAEKPPLWLGLLCAAVGLYFVLVGFGLFPIPGGKANLHSPLWIVVCAGLAFLLGGVAVIIQFFGRANPQGELPADAPAWMKAAQPLIGIAIATSLAMVGTWIAFGPGERQFSSNVPGVGAMVGRAAFGLGAIICWLFVLALVMRAKKQIFGGSKSLEKTH